MTEPNVPNVGDYVLATKWQDGDPDDHWCVGFLREEVDGRFIVTDANKVPFRATGFRRCERIEAEIGNWLLAHKDEIETSSERSIWSVVDRLRLVGTAPHIYGDEDPDDDEPASSSLSLLRQKVAQIELEPLNEALDRTHEAYRARYRTEFDKLNGVSSAPRKSITGNYFAEALTFIVGEGLEIPVDVPRYGLGGLRADGTGLGLDRNELNILMLWIDRQSRGRADWMRAKTVLETADAMVQFAIQNGQIPPAR
jgi:hypothetical protein